MKPSFWQVARRPKWIAGLAIALMIAVLFALFGNWQLSRSIRVTTANTDLDKVVTLEDLADTSSSFLDVQADRRVSTTVWIDPGSCVVIANRNQLLDDANTKPGFWAVLHATIQKDTAETEHIVVASAFFENTDDASAYCAEVAKSGLAFDTPIDLTGRYEPSEVAKARPVAGVNLFESLSVEQLINVWPLTQPKVYSGFIISDRVIAAHLAAAGEPIKIGVRKSQTELNLLSAFYAIEWILFSGFAVFMWGRLVQDERKRLEVQPK
ncbi:MAG: SURF1 family cytochrome oxidase biogenesis protein [Microbacteriaceae bacterium]